MKNKSNLDIKAGGISIFIFKGLEISYLPYLGFAAAKILHLAFKVAYIPAFAIEMVYYSMASWMAT